MWRFLLFVVGLAATSSLSAQELKLGHTLACNAKHVAFSPDGKTLASVSGSGEITLWNLATGKSTASLKGHKHKAWSVVFSPDRRTLALMGMDSTVELWDLPSSKTVSTIGGKIDEIYSLAFDPSGKVVATGENGKINLWDIATAKIIATYVEAAAKDAAVEFVTFSSDSKVLATVAGFEEVDLWDLSTGKGTVVFHEDVSEGSCLAGVAFSPDGKTLAVAGCILRNWIQLWNVATAKKTYTLAGHNSGGVRSFALTSDNKTLISVGGYPVELKVWDLVTGTNAATLGLKGLSQGCRIRFSPDGSCSPSSTTRRSGFST